MPNILDKQSLTYANVPNIMDKQSMSFCNMQNFLCKQRLIFRNSELVFHTNSNKILHRISQLLRHAKSQKWLWFYTTVIASLYLLFIFFSVWLWAVKSYTTSGSNAWALRIRVRIVLHRCTGRPPTGVMIPEAL